MDIPPRGLLTDCVKGKRNCSGVFSYDVYHLVSISPDGCVTDGISLEAHRAHRLWEMARVGFQVNALKVKYLVDASSFDKSINASDLVCPVSIN